MASIEYVVNATGNLSAFLEKAGLTADHLDSQLADLSKRVAAPEVDLKDTKFTLGMVNAAKRLDKLSAMVADPSAEFDAGKAQVEILRLNAMLDRLNEKRVTAHVKVDVDRSFLSRLRGLLPGGGRGAGGILGGLGGAGSAAGGAIGGIQSAGGQYGQAALYGAAGLGAAALGPAAIPAALGLGAGGLGLVLTQAKGLKTVFADIVNTLKTAAAPLKGAFGDILKGFDQFVKSQGPELRDLFKASLPFLAAFVKILEQAGKTILPVITQSLKQMQPYIPILVQGFTALIQGVADMIKALGPRGMEASAKIFVGLMKLMGAALTVFGKVMNFTAVAVEATAVWIHKTWDKLRHETAVIFDGMRHEIAHVWDQIYGNSIGRVLRIISDVNRFFKNLQHNIASIFDGIRHDIAGAWDTIWRNTVARTRNGVGDVVGWFRSLPGRVVGALFGLGHRLAAFAAAAMNEMLNGIRRVGGTILGWFGRFVGKIVGFFAHLLHHSPTGDFYHMGRNMMEGLAMGLKDHAHLVANAAEAAARRVANVGSGVQRWGPLVTRALRMEGLNPMLAARVMYQMQTESGGNPNAINRTDINAQRGDPSRGLLQTIGSTFRAYHWPGTSWNIYDPLANIAAAINYARHVYGPSLMSGGMGLGSGHGYALGGVITEPIWGIGASGRRYTFGERGPETVTPGVAGGVTYNVTINVPPGANAAAIGRSYVHAIKEYERSSGSGWRR